MRTAYITLEGKTWSGCFGRLELPPKRHQRLRAKELRDWIKHNAGDFEAWTITYDSVVVVERERTTPKYLVTTRRDVFVDTLREFRDLVRVTGAT